MQLIAENVSHAYRPDLPVLTGVHLEASSGEKVALMGPSGSGKSTLLSVLGNLLRPLEGSVALGGASYPLSVREASLRIGWVFQTVNALSGFGALDNACLPLLARGRPWKKAREEALPHLDAVGLRHVADRPVRTLSGGELQRLCIARALTTRPQLLLADEPTGQLDRATSARVLDALWNAVSDEAIVVVATHDPSVADRCDRVLCLTDGVLT